VRGSKRKNSIFSLFYLSPREKERREKDVKENNRKNKRAVDNKRSERERKTKNSFISIFQD
jgi:hypothetical protein